jgi:hypothetical protein
MHPRVQFDSLIGVERGGDPDWEAEIGSLTPELWEALVDFLAAQTADSSSCYFGLWDGWGWGGEVMRGPRLSADGRDYMLFTGALDRWASLFVGEREHHWQSPQLCWPEDRSWCVATEIDFDSTYIGGSTELIAAVTADGRFESCPAEPSDRVDYAGDEINGVP